VKQDVLNYAEEFSLRTGKHLGACLCMADKAASRWGSQGGAPKGWEKTLVDKWLNDRALERVTPKAKFSNERSE